MFFRITPTALEEYSPVLIEFKTKQNKTKQNKTKQTKKKTPGRDNYSRSHFIYVPSWGERFSPISTFFSLVSSHAFRDAPHTRFRCRDPNQWLRNFLKMLLLAIPQICTRVLHLWKTIDLHSVWVKGSRPYTLSFLP